jgi:large subunit ribosomal protein L23
MSDPWLVIRKPLVTEKSMAAQQVEDRKVYTFIVATEASKRTIKAAVEAIYNVKVEQVRTIKVKGKFKRMKNMLLEGRRKDWKKAYVTLRKGQRLDII